MTILEYPQLCSAAKIGRLFSNWKQKSKSYGYVIKFHTEETERLLSNLRQKSKRKGYIIKLNSEEYDRQLNSKNFPRRPLIMVSIDEENFMLKLMSISRQFTEVIGTTFFFAVIVA